MKYNYDFDIASIILYFVVLISFLFSKHVRNTNSRIFFALLIFSFFTPVLDIVGGETITRKAAPVFVHFANNLYYLTEQASNFLFLLYVLSILEMREHISIVKRILILSPILFSSIMIITNPVHGQLFTYNNNVYVSGPFRLFIVFSPLFYFTWAGLYSFVIRKNLSRRYSFIILLIAFINGIARTIQFFVPSFLVYSFSVSINMLLLLIGIQFRQKRIDTETEIGNRTYLAESIRKYIYNEVPFTTIMVRIADYDAMTSSYGIKRADQFIQNFAYALEGLCDKYDIFQVSSSCFSVALTGEQQKQSEELINKIANLLEEPKHVNGLEINCSYYVTSVSFPNQCPDRETFLSYLAYFQKTNGLPFGIVPAEELQIKDKKREDDVERAIERAIKNNSFEVYYQPICVSETQEFINAEALVRLTDPLLGPVSPSEFIPLSESNGSIIAIGNIVLEKVCKFLSRSDFEELGLSSIEVNLSTTQCLQRNFMSVIHDVTEKYKIEKKRLSFEITETASNLSPAVFTENLSKLQKDGYHLLLDDYGSGYSNLQRLVTTEFDVIKFDKDMIQKTCSDQKLQILYRKLQNIFHSMGAKLVAEGVETKEQYEFLKSAGCDFIQGYYFSKPLPENQFVEFLRTHKK